MTALAAVVVIGCGGGGHHSTKNSTTGTTTTTGGNGNPNDGLATGMTLLNPGNGYGRVEIEYLTGRGRAQGRDPGDTYLEITRQVIQNSDAPQDRYSRSDIDANSALELGLTSYQSASTGIDITSANFSSSPNSLLITQFVFDPNKIMTQTANGFVNGTLPTTAVLPDNIELTLPYPAEARIRAFPNRISVLQVRVNADMIYVDPNFGTYVFNRAKFDAINNSTTGTDPTGQNLLASRLSDYVRFDISGVATRPQLQTSSLDPSAKDDAAYVYFSGDNIALSTGASGGAFAEFAPTSDASGNPDVVIGNWSSATTVPSTGQTFPGTYNLREANPSPLSGSPASLTSLYGGYRDFSNVLTGGTTFEVIMFPNSGEEYDAARPGDLVAFVRDGTGVNAKITNMYYGSVDFGNGTIPGTFKLLPIRFLGTNIILDPSDSDNFELSGTVGKFLGASGSAVSVSSSAGPGAVRKFTFTFDQTTEKNLSGASKFPSGFAQTGTVTVFRS